MKDLSMVNAFEASIYGTGIDFCVVQDQDFYEPKEIEGEKVNLFAKQKPDVYQALYNFEPDSQSPITVDDAGLLNLVEGLTSKKPLETIPMLVSNDKGKKMSVDSTE